MAAAWRAVMRWFGIGKQEETKNQPVRHHPYDEVSDDQLEENRRGHRPLRSHPYDEVSDDQLEENRRRPPRSHPYDEVSDEQIKQRRPSPSDTDETATDLGKGEGGPPEELQPRQARVHPYDDVQDPEPGDEKGKGRSAPRMRIGSGEDDPSGGAKLNYVEVDVQPGKGPGGKSGGGVKFTPAPKEATIYSDVRPV